VAERGGKAKSDGQLMMDAATIKKLAIPFDPRPTDFTAVTLPRDLAISTYLSRV
jgi:hypothetical protein